MEGVTAIMEGDLRHTSQGCDIFVNCDNEIRSPICISFHLIRWLTLLVGQQNFTILYPKWEIRTLQVFGFPIKDSQPVKSKRRNFQHQIISPDTGSGDLKSMMKSFIIMISMFSVN